MWSLVGLASRIRGKKWQLYPWISFQNHFMYKKQCWYLTELSNINIPLMSGYLHMDYVLVTKCLGHYLENIHTSWCRNKLRVSSSPGINFHTMEQWHNQFLCYLRGLGRQVLLLTDSLEGHFLHENRIICFGTRLRITIGHCLTQEKPGIFLILLFMLLYIVRTHLAHKKKNNH